MAIDRRWIAGAGAAALAMAAPFIKDAEGKRNATYSDIVGVPTVCWGHTGPYAVKGRRYSDAQCEAILTADMRAHAEKIAPCFKRVVPVPAFAAAVSLSFNIGSGAFCRSTTLRRFNAGDIRGGCDAMLRWNMAGGRVVKGLVLRRERERALCLKGVA